MPYLLLSFIVMFFPIAQQDVSGLDSILFKKVETSTLQAVRSWCLTIHAVLPVDILVQ